MTDQSSTRVLAIDGGGTRCRLALSGQNTSMTVETGSANVSSDFEGATAELIRGVTEIARISATPIELLAEIPAYAGIAGVTGRDAAARLA